MFQFQRSLQLITSLPIRTRSSAQKKSLRTGVSIMKVCQKLHFLKHLKISYISKGFLKNHHTVCVSIKGRVGSVLHWYAGIQHYQVHVSLIATISLECLVRIESTVGVSGTFTQGESNKTFLLEFVLIFPHEILTFMNIWININTQRVLIDD